MPLHKYMIEHLLYPAMQHKGNQIRAILNELQLSQKANAPAVQYQRLIKLLLHCKQHVPAYAGLLPDDSVILTDPMAVLRTRIPLLPKTNFQQNPEAYLADDIPASSRIANCTGGSTGQPVHFYMTRHQVESYEAARWRGLSWYGITQGSRSVMLWGSPIELSKQAQLKNRLKESLLKNRRILSAYNLTEQDLTKHVRFLEHYRPEYLYGYATILTAFAQMLENAHITPNLSLKAVVSTSETLEKWQEELLSRVFRCPVANEYGARDAGILAYTCPDGGIHITAENCVIEVLDPVTHEPVPDGTSGILAITDLTNYVQPRLRYMLGDMGTLSTEECCCGRRLPLVPIIEKELLQRREEQMQNQKLYRKSYDTNYLAFVFVNDMGTLFKPDYITRHFKELLQRNNLKVIRVHDLRHPYVKHTTKNLYLTLDGFSSTGLS